MRFGPPLGNAFLVSPPPPKDTIFLSINGVFTGKSSISNSSSSKTGGGVAARFVVIFIVLGFMKAV